MVGAQPRRPFHFGIDQVEGIRWQIRFFEAIGAVDEHAGPAGDADPQAVWRLRPPRRLLEGLCGKRLKQRFDAPQAAGILSVEDVSGAVRAFFQQRCGKRRRPSVLHLNVDAGNVRELPNDGVDETLAPA